VTEHGIGASIRAARQARGSSLRSLAGALGVSPATLSAIERDLTPITVTRLERIAALLGTTPAALLSGGAMALPPRPSGDSVTGNWRVFEPLAALSPMLAAATRLFVRRGYHATSMREIAAEADVSVAGIYHHYPGKQHILSAVLDLTMAEITWRVEAARREGDGPVGSFSLMIESLALFHAVQRDLAFIGATEMRALDPAERARITSLRDAVQHALDDQAALCVSTGHFAGPDIRITTRAIATMCTSLPSWFTDNGPMRADEVARLYAGYAIKMLAAADASTAASEARAGSDDECRSR
jgi:AcrR family transcriptional regulator/DNA-binding XRE family transcriptional regulator